MIIFIHDKFITFHYFSSDMLLAYLGLRKLVQQDVDEYFVSIGLLSYTLTGKQIASQSITSTLISGLDKLIEKGYVIHVDKDLRRRRNEYVLNLSNFIINHVKDTDDYYSTIQEDCLRKLLSSEYMNKFELIRFYCYLMTTLCKTGDKAGVGFTSYENMADNIGLCRQIVSKYMDRLEEMGIIHIYRSTDAVFINGSPRFIPNVYGDVSIKEKVINVGKAYEQNYGANARRVKIENKVSSRSASAKYKILLKDLEETGQVRYSKDELREIYNILKDHNERYSYAENLQKDLSIFEKYGLLDRGDLHNKM